VSIVFVLLSEVLGLSVRWLPEAPSFQVMESMAMTITIVFVSVIEKTF
jgi:hypothetical protein